MITDEPVGVASDDIEASVKLLADTFNRPAALVGVPKTNC